MTEPDIIRRRGVEYEECTECDGVKCVDPVYICIRPKREQTGWACFDCAPDRCVCVFEPPVHTKVMPDTCPCDGTKNANWEPFYGKVDEEP